MKPFPVAIVLGLENAIGLSIVRELGGSLEIASPSSGGTRIRARLPIALPADLTDPIAIDLTPEPAAS